jgi:hypothetical protein
MLKLFKLQLFIQMLRVSFLVRLSVVTSIELFSSGPTNEFPDNNLQKTTADFFHLISKLSFTNVSIYNGIQLVKFKRPDLSSRAV